MQELEHGPFINSYSEEINDLLANVRGERGNQISDIKRIKVEVKENFRGNTVELVVDGRAIILTITGARDLAMSLRKAANRVNKNAMQRGFDNGKNSSRTEPTMPRK